MNVRNIPLSDSQERLLVRVMQATLFALVWYGLLTLNAAIMAPAGIGLAITFLPALLRREYGYSMDVGLVLWITGAVFLHILGSMGVYSRFPWYDEVTHTISAIVVAGIGYAAFRALELHSDEVDVPGTFRTVFIVVFVLAAAVAWEIFEFALGGFVTVYGIDDIVTDMIANTIGAMIMAIWGTGYVGDLVGFFRERFRSGSDT